MKRRALWFLLVMSLLLSACGSGGDSDATAIAMHVAETLTSMPTDTATLTPTPTSTFTSTPTYTFTFTPTLTETPTLTATSTRPAAFYPTYTATGLPGGIPSCMTTTILGRECTVCYDSSGNVTSNNCGF
jgi:hypothetical protein